LLPAIVIGVMDNTVIYLIPLLIGAMVGDRGFTEQAAGFMASADLAGYAVATVGTAIALDRMSWKRMALGGVGLMVAANIGTTFVFDRELFSLIRFGSGLGGGVLAALATVSLGRTDKPDRNYGVLFAATLLFGTAVLWGLRFLLERYKLNGAYFLIALLALLTSPAAASLPEGRVTEAGVPPAAPRKAWLLASVVLFSILVFWTEQNAVYAYLERIGNAAGLSSRYIGFGLGLANLTGFAGASLVAWLGTRYGRTMPLLVGTALQLGCFGLRAGRLSAATYIGGIGLLALAWNAMNPYLLGALAKVDASGKALAAAATAMGVGLAIGPAAVALVVGGAGGGYAAIMWLSGALAVLSTALMLAPLCAPAPAL